MCLMITLKVTKNQDFTLSLEDTFFEKPQGGGGQIDPPVILGLKTVPIDLSKLSNVVKNEVVKKKLCI